MTLGVTQFMLFAVLSEPLLGRNLSPQYQVATWHFIYVAYALAVVAVMRRAAYLYTQARYSDRVQEHIDAYIRALTGAHSRFALLGGVVSSVAGILTLCHDAVGLWNYVAACVIIVILLSGLLSMKHVGNVGQTSIEMQCDDLPVGSDDAVRAKTGEGTREPSGEQTD
jgi:hypothetical protein